MAGRLRGMEVGEQLKQGVTLDDAFDLTPELKTQNTALAEQFPVRQRSTGLALAYNIAVMIFGGFAQLIVTWLISVSGTPVAPAWYVMFGALVGVKDIFQVEGFITQAGSRLPSNLLQAHQTLDQTLERICIGRSFKSDTERLEYLFKQYVLLKQRGNGREAPELNFKGKKK